MREHNFCPYRISTGKCLKNPLLLMHFPAEDCEFTIDQIMYDSEKDELFISQTGERTIGECVDFAIEYKDKELREHLEQILRTEYMTQVIELEQELKTIDGFCENDYRILAELSVELANDYYNAPVFMYYRGLRDAYQKYKELLNE